jgi:hypothetical protein
MMRAPHKLNPCHSDGARRSEIQHVLHHMLNGHLPHGDNATGQQALVVRLIRGEGRGEREEGGVRWMGIGGREGVALDGSGHVSRRAGH